MRTSAEDIKKWLKQCGDMFLRRLMGMLAKMAKATAVQIYASGASEGRVAAATEQMARINDAWDTIRKARGM